MADAVLTTQEMRDLVATHLGWLADRVIVRSPVPGGFTVDLPGATAAEMAAVVALLEGALPLGAVVAGAPLRLAAPLVETPCAETGRACEWVSEEWYDDAGEMTSWDLYCAACCRWRDWTREEMPALPPSPSEEPSTSRA